MAQTLNILIDTEDNWLLSKYKWSINSRGYVQRKEEYPRKHFLLHRSILNITDSNQLIDHINGNKLDNRKSNLRLATPSQNQANSKLSCNNTSGYKGVSWHKNHKKYQVRICVNRQSKALGLYLNPLDAAKAYNKAAKRYFGRFAKLNII